MKRLILISTALAALVGTGLSAVIGKIALDHNPQGEFYACLEAAAGTAPDCHHTGSWFGLLFSVFLVGFIPTLLMAAVLGGVASACYGAVKTRSPQPKGDTIG